MHFTGKKKIIATKWAVTILSALSALYFGLGQIWGFPFMEQIVGSVSVINTVLMGFIATDKPEKELWG